MIKKTAVTFLMILAFGSFFGSNTCLAGDNPDATLKLKTFLKRSFFEINTVKALLDEGADINASNDYGKTLLIGASYLGNLDGVKMLLARGAEVNKTDKSGQSPLLAASIPMVGYFSVEGRVEFWFAPAPDRIEIVKLLLAKGADVNRADNEGATPLFVARIYGNDQIVALLKKNGAREMLAENEQKLRKKYRTENFNENFRMLTTDMTIAQIKRLLGPLHDAPEGYLPKSFFEGVEHGDFMLETDLYTLIFKDGNLKCWKGNCKGCVWQDYFLGQNLSPCGQLDTRTGGKR
jgi:uncharacterized protein